ncbi:MAG: Hpt domain-containing protein [Anaerolineae bacterium]
MSSAGDVIDPAVIESLRELGGGDDGFLHDLIRTYLDETPQLVAQLRNAVGLADAAGVHLYAHSLKGSSAEFGAAYLADLCRQMETAGKSRDLELAPDLLVEIEDEYGRVAAALDRLLEE